MTHTDSQFRELQETVWEYYRSHGRDLLWRHPDPDGNFNPYKIMVSELMLQQTQVARVTTKYVEFLERFPTVQSLAESDLSDVLRTWSGLGYNRRAKFLHQAAQKVCNEYAGIFPRTQIELTTLPGIGTNTAGAIMAYAFNEPVVFIETNVRTVIIHHFFRDDTSVPDKAVIELTEQVLDREHPREWYWALMDYGSFLKQTIGNISRQSKSYAKQSTFVGSKRQIRGQVIKLLALSPRPITDLQQEINDSRLTAVIEDLVREGLIRREDDLLSL